MFPKYKRRSKRFATDERGYLLGEKLKESAHDEVESLAVADLGVAAGVGHQHSFK